MGLGLMYKPVVILRGYIDRFMERLGCFANLCTDFVDISFSDVMVENEKEVKKCLTIKLWI